MAELPDIQNSQLFIQNYNFYAKYCKTSEIINYKCICNGFKPSLYDKILFPDCKDEFNLIVNLKWVGKNTVL